MQPVLDSLRRIYEMGFWLEVATLVVPGFNDSDEELQRMAAYLAGISRDIPWHVTAFHPAYRMEGPPATPPATLIRAAAIGCQAGLRYVYAGNLPGEVGDLENTRCPRCRRLLVERRGHRVVHNELGGGGNCPACRAPIPGLWSDPADRT
jgi:pyruvate formate lyase activating enzyme